MAYSWKELMSVMAIMTEKHNRLSPPPGFEESFHMSPPMGINERPAFSCPFAARVAYRPLAVAFQPSCQTMCRSWAKMIWKLSPPRHPSFRGPTAQYFSSSFWNLLTDAQRTRCSIRKMAVSCCVYAGSTQIKPPRVSWTFGGRSPRGGGPAHIESG
ncbi:hypothetical protein LX32DRAFT_389362 [Colletotrichum zoysiae]|uniref:Uncharacterized protein n=1 Tax=Colletotrichum zoysiae TaxID=1216348 RepID=A0AAD9M4Z9_9PEZI|nr:hypothetical protein LX32DRAFT_389362 [Colletotrichum zoysiae]